MLRFVYSIRIDAPVEVVFAFHEKPEALELLTPPWQKMEIVRREGGIRPGGEVEFRLRFGPLWLHWRARHGEFEPNRLFTDEQVSGPFRKWVHRHRFAAVDGATQLTDEIECSLPGGALSDLLFGWLVSFQLARLFMFRHRVTRRIVERTWRRGGEPPAAG